MKMEYVEEYWGKSGYFFFSHIPIWLCNFLFCFDRLYCQRFIFDLYLWQFQDLINWNIILLFGSLQGVKERTKPVEKIGKRSFFEESNDLLRKLRQENTFFLFWKQYFWYVCLFQTISGRIFILHQFQL